MDSLAQHTSAFQKAVRHLRGERVLCLADGSPITRDRLIKAVRGAQRVAGIDHTSAFALRALRRTRRSGIMNPAKAPASANEPSE